MTDESPIKFPARFPVKIMGRDTDEFHAALTDIFARHIAPLASLEVTQQTSREGRFISVTVVFIAESRVQLDALYSELSGSEHVLMAL
jgi:uncharacterized protein